MVSILSFVRIAGLRRHERDQMTENKQTTRGRPMDAAISLRNVTKNFGSHTVLEDISFDIPRGKVSAVMGPSGTGKSVLLTNVIGLLRPDNGESWVDGEETVSMGERGLDRVRRKVGVVVPEGALCGRVAFFEQIAFHC